MLTTAIPEDVWRSHTCLIVHPGPPGDRGPSSLDWAVQQGAPAWGVTVLEAVAEMDAGDVWASGPFPVSEVGKSELYRGEVADAALQQHVFWGSLLLALVLWGPGRWSVDAWWLGRSAQRLQR